LEINMRTLCALGLALLPIAAQAADNFTATNTYVADTQTWPIDKNTGYWTVTFNGVSQVTEGPIDTMAVECHGAGFWGPEGIVGGGICLHGSGDDTFILRFDNAPDGNTWEIQSGSGKYKSLSGTGTAVTERLAGNRRISVLVGEVSLGN
jgi:hypothetical protein